MHQCCYKLPIRSMIVLLELIFLRAKMKEVFLARPSPENRSWAKNGYSL